MALLSVQTVAGVMIGRPKLVTVREG